MLDLNIKNTEEKTETVYEVTATFTFTDKDLENEDTKAFYEMIKPAAEVENKDELIEDGVSQITEDYAYQP